MQSHGRIAAAVLAAAALLTSAACSGTPTSAPPAAAVAAPSPGATVRALTPDVAEQLDKAVTQTQRQAGVPGVIVGLWIPGKGSYVRAFGVADKSSGAPMSDGLHMRIGSETKTFTVTAILRLVDEGKVGLDDPVSTYVEGVPNGDRITLRQLAEMRSGLYPYSEDPDFGKAFLSDPNRRFTPQQLLDYAFKHPVGFEPGQKFQYSNTNAILLGLVVEKASGRRFGDYLKQQVLEPSNLDNTFFPTGAEFPEPHAHGYTTQTPNGEVADATNWDPSWAWSAGAMISDLSDLREWARIVATGTLLKPATQAERLRTLPTGDPGTGYGLGIFNSHGWIGHNGSLPGYQSVTVYLPSAEATLVILTNTDTSYEGNENSTLFAKAVTTIVTPANVYDLPPTPVTSASPSR
ncbi:serine hydrolase domain-containing protein [Streptomyces himalayensis]|uniref:Beta-lactamase family protein n=1 Tax=Streptomyces himalayensis subsp. himalayensis TaxID=2756131 RepID=A0A7W0DJJ3_9ACTN|nr:serine hydrolase domain-containing protein [Streptomyces himalayensis]MBA2946150.1 beta-lactamase family protein [Streptomyces himalayensis subsp. himalayensis]